MKVILAFATFVALARADTCTTPVQRKNFTSLTNNEKLNWLNAEVCLTTHDAVFGLYDGAKTLWDEQQYLHLTMSNYIHGVVSFNVTRTDKFKINLPDIRDNSFPGTATT